MSRGEVKPWRLKNDRKDWKGREVYGFAKGFEWMISDDVALDAIQSEAQDITIGCDVVFDRFGRHFFPLRSPVRFLCDRMLLGRLFAPDSDEERL